MTASASTLPPARERHKSGIRPFTENFGPHPDEALPDKVVVRVTGSIQARSEEDIRQFALLVGTTPTAYSTDVPRLFGAGNWRGRKWVAKCVGNTTISDGEISLLQQGCSARIDIELWVNPIRTLEHLLARHRFDEVTNLSAVQFFTPSSTPPAAGVTLDRNDNMVSDFVAFGSTVQSDMVQRVATYLSAFECALKGRILEELTPREQGYSVRDQDGIVTARNDDCRVELHWGELTVTQFEACWEREHPDALAAVHRLADEVLIAARRGEVNTHLGIGNCTVARELGAMTVRVPLIETGKIVLVIYAKAANRIRVEVRYLSRTPREVRQRLPSSNRRLTDWFDAFRHDAAPRVPWDALHHLMAPVAQPSLDAMLDLLDAVTEAAGDAKAVRRALLRKLLTAGAVTATDTSGDTPAALLQKLERRGVLEHVRLVGRDAAIGRRYRLAPAYAGLVGAIEPSDCPHSC